MHLLLLLLLLASFSSGGAPLPQFRIHSGRQVSRQEIRSSFSFIVSILSCDRGGRQCMVCTGSLVASNVVLTAAHCCCGARYLWIFGPSHTSLSGPRYTATCRHSEKFNCQSDSFNHDIATMKLKTPIPGASVVPLDCRWPRVGQHVTFLGYGEQASGEQDQLLRIGHSRFTNCRFFQPSNGPVVCITVNYAWTVQSATGDSGGPVLVKNGGRWHLIAVQNGAQHRPGRSYPADHIFNPVANMCADLRRTW